MEDAVRYMERAYVIALDAGRKDLQTIAAQVLAQTHIIRLELDEAELLLTRALELAGESGSVRARVGATLSYGWFLALKGELTAAETLFEEVRASSAELGVEPAVAAALTKLGWISRLKGDLKRAEKYLREAVRITETRGDLGVLPDQQAALAETLADLGKVDEAERLAMEARSNAGVRDTSATVAAATALAAVRAAQGREDEAEELLDSALEVARVGDFKAFELEPLGRLVRLPRGVGPKRRRERSTKRGSPSSRRRLRAPPGSPESTARPATRRSPSPDDRSRRAPRRRGSARNVPSPYGRCFVSLRFAKAMSEKWMWNGASAAAPRRRPREPRRTASSSRNAPSLVACMCAKSSTGRTHVVRRAISNTSSSEPRSRTRPITSTPNGTARSFPSSLWRRAPSCSTTAASASSRSRSSRKPGWNTTSSAPLAAAMPALRSSAPTADVNFRPLASTWPMNPKSGACTDSAMSCSRASSPSRSANG